MALTPRIPTEFTEGTPYRVRSENGLPEVPGHYPHQLDALAKLEGSTPEKKPPVSGIVHLPTGAGKTRIGLEHIARALKNKPKQQFIWATESRGLIQQTMRKALEYASLFPLFQSLRANGCHFTGLETRWNCCRWI
jgi:superfamily II DNA or RNA helicase